MADNEDPQSTPASPHHPEEQTRLNPIVKAALLSGGVAVAAGAYFGTRSLARRNREKDGRPINSVMAAAITACDLSHEK